MSTGTLAWGRKRLGPNTVARFISDILLWSSFSETLRSNRDKRESGDLLEGAGFVVGPLQVVQEVEEGVPVGFRTGLEDGHHGREAGLHLLDVCKGDRKHPETEGTFSREG